MRVLLILALLIVIGVVGLNYLKQHDQTSAAANDFSDRARGAAVSAKDSIARHLDEWHLSGDDIKRDLQKGGEIVRTKAQSAGSSIATAATNAKVATVIQTKYSLDKDLSPRSIKVSADQGKVILSGTVASEELIGRAVALALDTEGVTEVKSQLVVAKP